MELLVAMFLMLICLAIVNMLFAFGLKSYYQYMDRVEVQENLRIGINRISREVRQASQLLSCDNSGRGRLTFKIIDGSNEDVISYAIKVSGDSEGAYQLIRSINGFGNNPVARYIHTLTVIPDQVGPDTRTVTLILVGEKGNSGEMEVSTTVTLRNYQR